MALTRGFLTYDEIAAALEDVELTKGEGWFSPLALESAACCKRSASIALPQGCHRVLPKRTPAAENWL